MSDKIKLLFLHGTKAVCPFCSGLVTKQGGNVYACRDCHTVYAYDGPGPADEKEIYVSVSQEGISEKA